METLRRWLPLLRIPIALAGVALFFALYNRFLLDANLRNLRASLSILDAATGVGQAEAALLLVDQTLLAQAAEEDADLSTLQALQFVQGALASDRRTRPVEDAQAMVAILAEDRVAERPGLLAAMDRITTDMQSAFQQAGLAVSQIFNGPVAAGIDDDKLEKAARLEQLAKFQEMAALYEELLAEYPNYVGRAGIHLRLGYVYQRLQTFDRAERHYREGLRQAQSLQEAATARQMLQALEKARGRRDEIQRLEASLEGLGGAERQQAEYRLGSALIQVSAMDRAAAIFRDAHAADPDGELAAKCLFKAGWCLRMDGKFPEALACFQEVISKYPKTSWASAGYIQMGEIHKILGDTAAAMQAFHLAAGEEQDHALSALAHVHMGSTALFDMKDPEKASTYFHNLENNYPASSFAGLLNRVQGIQQEKSLPVSVLQAPGTPPPPTEAAPEQSTEIVLEADTPIVNWLEGFLPVFVDVFSDRLAKYMDAAGERELTRRFTEFEFRDLVVRQVQRRFPGQVSEIQTHIWPEGFVGTGKVKLGILTFNLSARIGIVLADDRPHAILHEVKAGLLSIPGPLLKMLEKRVNSSIDRADYPLRVTRYELHEGYALISVELKRKPTGALPVPGMRWDIP